MEANARGIAFLNAAGAAAGALRGGSADASHVGNSSHSIQANSLKATVLPWLARATPGSRSCSAPTP